MKILVSHLLLLFRRFSKMLSVPSVTIQYPFVAKQISSVARSQFRLELGDCTGCQNCEKLCPVAAVDIRFAESLAELGRPDERRVQQIHVDYGLCVACGICVDSCEPKALQYKKEEFPVATQRDQLRIGLVRNKALPEVARR